MSLEGIVSTLPEIIGMLPLIMQASQIMFFVFFIWFFGTMTMKGFRGKRPLFVSTVGTLVIGALCLVAATSFSGFIPFLSKGLLSVLQLDVILAGVLVSVIFSFALSLMTHTSSPWSPSERVKLLERKVANLEELLRRRAHHISDHEAMHIAEHVMNGYKARHAKLVGNEYEVILKKNGKEGRVVIDVWDGEVKSMIFHESALRRFFTDPTKLMGLLIFVAVTSAALLFFEGFPNPADDITSMFGLDIDALGSMASMFGQNPLLGGEVPQGCVSPTIFVEYADELQDRQYILDHLYDDDEVASIIENNCGPPRMMIRFFHLGNEVIMGFTPDGRMGYTTDRIFCSCIDTEMPG
ncbi:MAG: hypothetical protein JSV63_03210 [Candidatus Aenigmatarchaeota archaeon]|nr:MAG: hypothetical protein JSV63_03210 [Candidatus Aenigmarchaeota archaeon]